MSNPPSDAAAQALAFLKGRDNPFDSLVRPQRMDENFRDVHVPELLRAERDTLFAAIDRFRVANYQRAADLPPSRTLLILGERGAGKTHLLRSLRHEERGVSQLLVQPTFYQADLPIEEYLLSRIVAVLLEEDEVYHGRPIEDLAHFFTRRLLQQALLSASPTDLLYATAPRGWRRWRLLWGGGNAGHERLLALARKLTGPEAVRSLRELVLAHGLTPQTCVRLLAGHLQHFERGDDLLPTLRRHFYAAMARLALLDERAAVERFLTGEYLQTKTAMGTRYEIVNQMLHVLLEACALVRMPIVIAFDNLERFCTTSSQFDAQLTTAFFNNLAQALDNTHGLLFFIFAEKGFFQNKIAPLLDEFARARLEQGVPLPGMGPRFELSLAPPSAEALRELIDNRMRPLLREAPPHGALPSGFPFPPDVLERELCEKQPTLRATLYRLREIYSQHVYGIKPATPTPPAAPPRQPPPLEPLWQQHLATAEQRLQAGSTQSHLQELHAGLGEMLRIARPLTHDDGQLHDVQPCAAVGDNANSGVVTYLDWRVAAGKPAESKLLIAVGLLVGRGPGMARDLEAKFDAFRSRTQRIDRLLVLWPTDKEGDPVELLPPKTREQWRKLAQRRSAVLLLITAQDLRTLLALPSWLNAVQDQLDPATQAREIRSFVLQRCQGLCELIVSHTSDTAEREPAHAN